MYYFSWVSQMRLLHSFVMHLNVTYIYVRVNPIKYGQPKVMPTKEELKFTCL